MSKNSITKTIPSATATKPTEPKVPADFVQIPCSMFSKVRSGELNATDYLTYNLIVAYTITKDECFPKQETLAEVVGWSGKTIQRSMAKLESAGIIRRSRRGMNKSKLIKILNKVRLDPTPSERPSNTPQAKIAAQQPSSSALVAPNQKSASGFTPKPTLSKSIYDELAQLPKGTKIKYGPGTYL